MINLREGLSDMSIDNPLSPASQQARSLGLKYVGFGRYEDPTTETITHVVENDRLVPFKSQKTNNTTQDRDSYNKVTEKQTKLLQDTLSSHYTADKYDSNQLQAIHTFIENDNSLSVVRNANMNDVLSDTMKMVKTPLDFLVYTTLSSDINVEDIKQGTSFKFRSFKNTSTNLNSVIEEASDGAQINPQNDNPYIVLLQIKIRKNSNGVYAAGIMNSNDGDFIMPKDSLVEVNFGPEKIVMNSGDVNNTLEVVYFDCLYKK